jgi:hypothetical protein
MRELILPFPLIGGGMATLSVPIPLSQKNYVYLKQMVNTMLEGMEEAIVEVQASETLDGKPQEEVG